MLNRTRHNTLNNFTASVLPRSSPLELLNLTLFFSRANSPGKSRILASSKSTAAVRSIVECKTHAYDFLQRCAQKGTTSLKPYKGSTFFVNERNANGSEASAPVFLRQRVLATVAQVLNSFSHLSLEIIREAISFTLAGCV